MMARHAHEFSCTECGFWNYPMLSDDMSGCYIIKCGNCGHEHHRHIEKGRVTDKRHLDGKNMRDVIHVMKSACQKDKRQLGIIAQLRNQLFAGGNDG
jgi:DNA-directed RNA polymerase subunit RPC12/RpoP